MDDIELTSRDTLVWLPSSGHFRSPMALFADFDNLEAFVVHDLGKFVSCILSGVFPFHSTFILPDAEELDPSSNISLTSSPGPVMKIRGGRRTASWLLDSRIFWIPRGALDVDVAEEGDMIDEE